MTAPCYPFATRVMLPITVERKKQRGTLRVYASIPFIYGMIVPLAFVDLCVTVYQAAAFRCYGIPRIVRRKYVRWVGRGHGMVRWIDRFNCAYCSYANGVAAYLRAVLIETEKYWCPIKYAARGDFHVPHPQDDFADPGDEDALRKIVVGKKGG